VHMTDAELAHRAQEGDTAALRLLFERHYDGCWRFARQMLRNAADADDAVQDTFFKAFRALPRYQERTQFRDWLYTILVNQCRTLAQSKTRHLHRLARLQAIDVPRSVDPTPLADDTLQAALAQLDAPAQEAIFLRYGADMDYNQMSQVTGVGVSALKMRVKRACERLRLLLDQTT
jgi:RNA polymerase sigma-70 factor, ECF subfamily